MKRKYLKIRFHFLRKVIGLLIYFDSKIYMKYYNKLLKKSAIILNGTPRFIANTVKLDDFDSIAIGDRFVASMNVHFLTHDYSYTTALIAIDEKPETDIGIEI